MTSSSKHNETSNSRVLVTGANGFIGAAIMRRLLNDGVDVKGAVRQPTKSQKEVCSPSLGATTANWRPALSDRSVVVHIAARAHILNEHVTDPVELFRQVNSVGTLQLASQAAEMGVRRFVFLSSIGVNGTQNTQPFKESDPPCPHEPYAISKLEAEQGLMALAGRTGMEVVILRSPLVYGPNAPGNFGLLAKAVNHHKILPLGAVTKNRRTLVGLDNLVDLIVTCVHHPGAANQVFLAGDNEDLSTTELLHRMARAFGVKSRLLPVPVFFLKAAALAIGKGAMIDRLCGSLRVDITKAREVLGWTPPISVDEGLKRAAGDSRVDQE